MKRIFKKSISGFEKKYGNNHLWNYFRVFTIDWTKYTLPASKELIKKYGCQKRKKDESIREDHSRL